MSLDNVLDGTDPVGEIEEGQEQVVDQKAEQKEELQASEGEGEEGQSETTSQPDANQKHVPLAALEAERKGRQDWKEKALRLEGEMKAIREQQERQQEPRDQQQQVAIDPVFNTKLDMSEVVLRQHIGDDAEVDAMISKFEEMVKQNPSLGMEMAAHKHPWKFAYDHAKKAEAMQEIGSDPTAYRSKLEAEIRAQIAAEAESNQSAEKPQAVLPKSLAGARSAAGRNAPTFTGPASLDDVLFGK